MGIKVKRHGLGTRTVGKTTFRKWLDAQPRKALTYSAHIPRKDETGWLTEDFIRESGMRGLELRFGTCFKWASNGTQPREIAMQALRRVFENIEF